MNSTRAGALVPRSAKVKVMASGHRRSQPSGDWRVAAIAAALSVLSLGCARAAPVRLDAGPVRVDVPQDALARRGARLHLDGLSAAKPPGVIFHVFLGLKPGERPKRDDPRYVGAVSFYDAVRSDEGVASEASANLELAPTLARMRAAGLAPTAAITIVSSGVPAPGSAPSIASVAVRAP